MTPPVPPTRRATSPTPSRRSRPRQGRHPDGWDHDLLLIDLDPANAAHDDDEWSDVAPGDAAAAVAGLAYEVGLATARATTDASTRLACGEGCWVNTPGCSEPGQPLIYSSATLRLSATDVVSGIFGGWWQPSR
ncbi:MAG: hypothetical protein L0H96_03400 [Humibacillus sp.]|nr:hypothetical protein [Humibacillus sp.]MDN5775938.1 hypothetical protein [Humibacillus sp.]